MILTIHTTYKTVIGVITANTNGVSITMTTTVLSSVENITMKKLQKRGNLSSRTSISLENLLIILPMGVVWKNDIGEWKMRINIVECILLVASTKLFVKQI